MAADRSKPGAGAPVLIRILEEDPLEALRMLAALRTDGFEVEVYSGQQADGGAGADPRRTPLLAGALRGSMSSLGGAEQGAPLPGHQGDGPADTGPGIHTSAGASHADGQIQLVARIRAILHPDSEAHQRTRRLAVGPFEIDRGTHRAKRGGRPVHLGPTDFRLFEFFLQHPNAAQSRQAIRAAVWGSGAAIEERTIDVHVGRLRRAVAKGSEHNPIVSIRGVGYVFEPGPDATGSSGRSGQAG